MLMKKKSSNFTKQHSKISSTLKLIKNLKYYSKMKLSRVIANLMSMTS